MQKSINIIHFLFLMILISFSNNLFADPFDEDSEIIVKKDNEKNLVKPSLVKIKSLLKNSNQSKNQIPALNTATFTERISNQITEKKSEINNPFEIKNIQMFLTDPSAKIYLTKQETPKIGTNTNDISEITVNQSEKYQTIDGFGFALTGGSAYLLSNMSYDDRAEVLKKFYDPQDGIGVSMVRISIGASDLSRNCFSYDEKLLLSDKELKKFNIYAGDKEVIPTLKEILEINPNIKILATPWSAPKWMKTNRLFGGGSLKPKYYQAYADYFVKYLQTMKENGINISAISVQNEPECGTNKPSMLMDASSQAKFIGQYLGPTLEKNDFGDIEIFCWDHNCDKKDFALSVLGDSNANKYVSGSAWHLYAGDINILSEVYQEQPEKAPHRL